MQEKISKYHLTSGDLEAIAGLIDQRTAVLVTKDDLKNELNGLGVSLKAYIHEGVETVMTGMDEMIVKFDVHDRVGKLEKDVRDLKLNRQATI